MLRGILLSILIFPLLAGCDSVVITISSQPAATQFPTATPYIITATPIILPPPITVTFPPVPFTETFTFTPPALTDTSPAGTITPTSTLEPTSMSTPFGPSATNATTGPTPFVSINTVVLGCNTSLDITHGMGEVTNAYVTISNIGAQELDDVCATLNALDEGRPHPDKTKCVPALPIQHQVTQKLTVDTTFNKSTPIQVYVTYALGLLQRVAQDSCTDLGIFVPDLGELGVVKPIQ